MVPVEWAYLLKKKKKTFFLRLVIKNTFFLTFLCVWCQFRFNVHRTSPTMSTPHGLTLTWWECCGLCLSEKPTELAHFLFHRVLGSISVFMALSNVFYSINSPDNYPLSHSVLMVLFLPYWSFKLYISLRKSPSALRYSLLVDWAQNTSQLTNHSTTVHYSRLVRLPSFRQSNTEILWPWNKKKLAI